MDLLVIGLIKTSHGLKGYLKLKSLSGEIEHFFRLKKVYIRKKDLFFSYPVESVKGTATDVLIKLEGIDTPEEASEYRGLELWADRKDASPLKKGEYYLADICKCRVYQGLKEVGKVKSVSSGGQADLLEVQSRSGTTFMIPFIDRFVGEIDLRERRIFLKEELTLP